MEKQLEDIHKNIYDMTWASGSSLSYNHDNDLFYRLPKYGCFDFGLTASLSLRCINNFKNPYVLDLGCADGFYFKRFYSYLENIRYVGCDKDTYSINKAKQLFSKEKRCSFLECDFIENMPLPCEKDYFTNVLWYASMQMFNTNDQRIILHNIKKRMGKEGILCGSAIIKENSWEYCINYFNGINSLKELLEEFFENVVVYSDFGMGDYAVFIASQSKLQIRNEIY